MMTRRQFLSASVAATLLVGGYAWQIEPTWVEYVRRKLPIKGLPGRLEGRSLVQLSDIHVGDAVDSNYLARVFGQVAALEPDIIAYTGDFVTHAGPATLDQLRGLAGRFPRGRLGTVAVLGNHDYGARFTDWAVAGEVEQVLANHGCVVLRNQCVQLGGLVIGGLDDLWSGRLRFSPMAAAPALMLCHNPDACDLPGWGDYQGWILSGHTHGGQCKPPFLPAPLLPVRNRRYTAGKFDLSGSRTLYINRGLGHLLHVRFNVRPEVTVFRLTRTTETN